MTRVVLTDSARQDQLEIWLYIAADSPDAADRLLDEIDKALRLLSGAPGARREAACAAAGLKAPLAALAEEISVVGFLEWPGLLFAGNGKATFASPEMRRLPSQFPQPPPPRASAAG